MNQMTAAILASLAMSAHADFGASERPTRLTPFASSGSRAKRGRRAGKTPDRWRQWKKCNVGYAKWMDDNARAGHVVRYS